MPELTRCDERAEEPIEDPVEEQSEGSGRKGLNPKWKRLGRQGLMAFAVLLVCGAATFLYFEYRYGRVVDGKLRQGPFGDTASIFVNSHTLRPGEATTVSELTNRLRAAGFTASQKNPIGWYENRGGSLAIHTAARGETILVRFSKNQVAQILLLPDKTALSEYPLHGQMIANVSLKNRERRRLLRFDEIPQPMIQAVVSTEDKRFFRHHGFDFPRILKAAYVNLRNRRTREGASTITMQLVRSFWLKPDKEWGRKEAQFFMALRLERKLTKQQIFEEYANEVYLGHRGTYDIHGFGEAARMYFGKEIGAITLSEAATLAGMIQRPGYYNPFAFPERVEERRNRVLGLMRKNGYLNDVELAEAKAERLQFSSSMEEAVEAPYSVDLVKAEMQDELKNARPGREGYQVYSTLDPRLQHAAREAVRIGMAGVDQQVRQAGKNQVQPQVALVALDPKTGAIRALVGGRDYNASQLNHALVSRQPGSVFKPFVYATALRTAEQRGVDVFTPATLLDDVPTTFWFAQHAYEPNNSHQDFSGEVTLRYALSRSLNIPTIQLAERVGYGRVVDLARKSGFAHDIQPTPAVALGSYESTPLEIAAAYTVFANQGVFVKPHLVSYVRGEGGEQVYAYQPVTHTVLTPQVAYLMVNLLEEVLRSGTGAGVRARGLTVPAAGKTGTSRDGWFVGFTSDLLCVVWVGFDDNRDLKLEGAKSALPIWTEFMKRAVALMGPPAPFRPPSGIVTAQVDAVSGMLATPACTEVRTEVFLSGTEPSARCDRHFVETATPIASVGVQ